MMTTLAQATALAVSTLTAAGVPETAARTQALVLLEADLRGQPSHGMLRLPRILERIAAGVTDPVTMGVHRWTSTAMLDVDGRGGLGAVVATHAIDLLCERVGSTGVACAAVRSNNHLGMLAWYVERIADRGLVGVMTTSSEALVHPWGGRFATHGTNPLAISVPAKPRPLVMDMSTGLVSMGKVHDYAYRGLPLEPGWVLDEHGDATVDAAAGVGGSIAPFGGAKGYALGLALEVLIGALTSSALGAEVRGTLDSVHPCTKGDVILVLRGPDVAFLPMLSSYLDQVRATTPTDPDTPVLVPGDRARRRREVSLVEGIDIADPVWEAVMARAPVSWAG
jgi:LDH2 family malate/lactate/ureidoglycolate dehydrogenase